MPVEENKVVVRRFFELLNAGDLDAIRRDLLAPDYRLRFDSVPELDRDAAVGFFGGFLAAFPGIRHAIEDQFAEGDRVASGIVVRGTHAGEFMGLPPTGRAIEVPAINIHSVVDGMVAAQWVVSDGLGMLQQLGAIPAPGAGGGTADAGGPDTPAGASLTGCSKPRPRSREPRLPTSGRRRS